MQYASSSCFIIVAILLFRSGNSNSFAISSFWFLVEKKVEKMLKFLSKSCQFQRNGAFLLKNLHNAWEFLSSKVINCLIFDVDSDFCGVFFSFYERIRKNLCFVLVFVGNFVYKIDFLFDVSIEFVLNFRKMPPKSPFSCKYFVFAPKHHSSGSVRLNSMPTNRFICNKLSNQIKIPTHRSFVLLFVVHFLELFSEFHKNLIEKYAAEIKHLFAEYTETSAACCFVHYSCSIWNICDSDSDSSEASHDDLVRRLADKSTH